MTIFAYKTLSSSAIEMLGQLFLSGPTWDGNVVSKAGRGELFELKLAERYEGFTQLTYEGLRVALEWDVKGWADRRWYRKQQAL